MSDRIRQGTALVIAMGMVIAVAAAPTVSQTAEPNAERVFEVAGINADKVDGRHAVMYTINRARRARKLVATNAGGFLPGNIVKPKWSLIRGMPSGFRDGTDNAGVRGVRLLRITQLPTLSLNFPGAGETRMNDVVFVGEGAYDGLLALVNVETAGDGWDLHGYIVDDDSLPSVEPYEP